MLVTTQTAGHLQGLESFGDTIPRGYGIPWFSRDAVAADLGTPL